MLAWMFISLGVLAISIQANVVPPLHTKNPIVKFLERQTAPPLVPNEFILDNLMAHVKHMRQNAAESTSNVRLIRTGVPNLAKIPSDNSYIKLVSPEYSYLVRSKTGAKNTANMFFDFIDKRTKMNRLFETINKTDELNSTTLLTKARTISSGSITKRAGQYMLRDKSLFKNPIQMIVPINSPGIELIRTKLSTSRKGSAPISTFIQDKNPLQIPFNKMNIMDRILLKTVPNDDVSMDIISIEKAYLSPNICKNLSAGAKLAYPLNSHKFLVCQAQDSYDLLDCPDDLIFDEAIGRCDYPEAAMSS